MKTIILITTSYPSGNDGSEAAGSFVEDFAAELATRARVFVVAPGKSGEQASSNHALQLQVVRYVTSGKPLSLLKAWNPLHWPAIFKVLQAGAHALESLVKSEKVDHIFALWVLPSGAWARQMQHKYAIPYSTWALGSDIWVLGKLPLVRTMLRKVLRDSTNNFADGQQLCRDVEMLSTKPCVFLPSTRKFVVPPQQIATDKQGVNLAFLGRWHANKGIDLLLTALLQLSAEDWHLINEIRIFGGGPLHDLVHEQVAQLRQQGRPVTVGGYLDKSGAASLFAWTDYVLIPSRIESIPVVFSDAMKAGKPVLATPVGDLGELIASYQCGLVTTSASADALTTGLQQALRQERSGYAPGIERAARDFSLPAITGKFLAAI